MTGSLDEETSVNFAAVLVIGLAGLSILLIVLFGIRSLSFGKVKMTTLALIAIPLVAVAICMMLGSSLDPNNPYSAGALLAMAVVFVLAIAGIALSGVKSAFGV
jgi:membrane-associated HD superfamily phosphohydrolase